MERTSLTIILLLAVFCRLAAIVPPLEREISLHLKNETIAAALTRIQDQTQLIFSYKAALISTAAPVSINIQRKTVREALSMLLPKNILYKSKNNYIILKEKPAGKLPEKSQISGYVYDQATQQRLPNVTVYDKESLRSATTNEYGYYSMTVPAVNSSITVNKENYNDTVVAVSELKEQAMVNFTIQPRSFLQTLKDSLHLKEKLSEVNAITKKTLQDFKGFVNTVNIRDSITRDWQVSLLPFIGTNHRLSGTVYNRLSINIYGGYARGLRGLELGGLFNIDKENVKGLQAAGLFNIAGDSLSGSQFAGLMNVTGRHAGGFQAAGLMNINSGSQKGFQGAGLMNISEASDGTSAAGLLNISASAHGFQVAGLANINDTLEGAAVSGLFNSAHRGKNAVQISGLFNRVESGSTRLQISALFNVADDLQGSQISVVNFADSATGVPLGLISIVKKGVHQLELSADELFHTNLSLRTGVHAFYNIITVGIQPGTASALWHLGYGLGTSFKIAGRFRADLSGTVQHISKGSFYFAANEVYRFYAGVEYKAGKKFSIAAGPVYNFFITDALTEEYATHFGSLGPKPLFSRTDSYSYNRKGWFGARVALRFF